MAAKGSGGQSANAQRQEQSAATQQTMIDAERQRRQGLQSTADSYLKLLNQGGAGLLSYVNSSGPGSDASARSFDPWTIKSSGGYAMPGGAISLTPSSAMPTLPTRSSALTAPTRNAITLPDSPVAVRDIPTGRSTDWAATLPTAPKSASADLLSAANIDYARTLADTPTLEKPLTYDRNGIPASYTPGAELLSAFKQTPDWQKSGQEIYDAYMSSANADTGQTYSQRAATLESDLARRGITDSSIGDSAKLGLENWQMRQAALNKAAAVQAKQATGAALRSEGATNATSLAGLERTSALDATDRYSLGEELAAKNLETRNAVAQQGYNNSINRTVTAADLRAKDVAQAADIAQTRQGLDLGAYSAALGREVTAADLASGDIAQNAQLAQMANAGELDRFGADLSRYTASGAQNQQDVENQYRYDQALRGNETEDYDIARERYLTGLDADRAARSETDSRYLQGEQLNAALRAENRGNYWDTQSYLSNLYGANASAADMLPIISGQGSIGQTYGDIADQYAQIGANNAAMWGSLAGTAGSLVGYNPQWFKRKTS